MENEKTTGGHSKSRRPLSFEEQVDLLAKHNLIIDNRQEALDFLRHVNYYRLKGYMLQFRSNPESGYLDPSKNITFSQIRKIYEFDEELRNLLLKNIEKIEVFLRSVMASAFSKRMCANEPYTQHYNIEEYEKPKEADEIIVDFEKTKASKFNKSLVYGHYEGHYNGKYPIWVLVEMLSLSSLSKLYASMKRADQEIVAKSFCTGTMMLKNNLQCLTILRNLCAHCERLYNYPIAKPLMTSDNLKENKEFKIRSLFAYICNVTRLLPTPLDKALMIVHFSEIISKYNSYIDHNIIGLPSDYFNFLLTYSKCAPNALMQCIDNLNASNADIIRGLYAREQILRVQEEKKVKQANRITLVSIIVTIISIIISILIWFLK